MAYVPPHKRHSKDADSPSPKPELLAPQFWRKMTFRPSGSNVEQRKEKISLWRPNVLCADHAIYRWFAVGLENDGHLLPALRLEPVSIKAIEQKMPMMLVLDNNIVKDKEVIKDGSKSPWDSIADQVLEDLLCSWENLEKVKAYEVHPKLVARFGKVLFHGNQSVNIENVQSVPLDETILRQKRRLFRTNVPISYLKYITDEVVSRIGLEFEEEKEVYYVNLCDNNLPGYTISCKCRVMKDSDKLDVYKLETNQMRRMVTDISCLQRDLDLRLMLWSKKNLTVLTEDEMNNIHNLIAAAVIDRSVKGGLRWSLGKDSTGGRYTVVDVWHTICKMYRSPSNRLEVRNADRIDFRTSSGEVTAEVNLKMKGILSQLRENNIKPDLVAELLKENIKLIWDCFLFCDSLIK